MASYTHYTLAQRITAGYFLPKGYVAYGTISGGFPQLVFSGEVFGENIPSVYTSTSSHWVIPATGVAVILLLSSDLNSPVIPIAEPAIGMITYLVEAQSTDNAIVGYQYVNESTGWVRLGAATYSPLLSASVGGGSSTGIVSSYPCDTFTTRAKVVTASTLPSVLAPFTTYVDKLLGVVYFPLPLPTTLARPEVVMAITDQALAANIADGDMVHISRSGYGLSKHLAAVGEDDIVLTMMGYNALVNDYPVKAFRGPGTVILASALASATGYPINYDALIGLDPNEPYQFAGGYFRGANNLWDTVIVTQGTLSSNLLTRVSEHRRPNVMLAQLFLSPGIADDIVNIYVAKEGLITADNILFELALSAFNPRVIRDIRLAPGEAIYLKLAKPTSLNYRCVVLSRS